MHHGSSLCTRNIPHKANWSRLIIPWFPSLGRRTRRGWNSSSYLQTTPIPPSTWKCVDMPRCWPRSRRSRLGPRRSFMSNYVDEQAEYIQQLTLRHQAYFDICRQELHQGFGLKMVFLGRHYNGLQYFEHFIMLYLALSSLYQHLSELYTIIQDCNSCTKLSFQIIVLEYYNH